MIEEDWKNISSKKDFTDFLKFLSEDSQKKKDEWENWTIADYLESIAACVNDSSSFDSSNEAIDWRFTARIFLCGKYYE